MPVLCPSTETCPSRIVQLATFVQWELTQGSLHELVYDMYMPSSTQLAALLGLCSSVAVSGHIERC